jgi:hypothetical protein
MLLEVVYNSFVYGVTAASFLHSSRSGELGVCNPTAASRTSGTALRQSSGDLHPGDVDVCMMSLMGAHAHALRSPP